ncbi:hypothetical protein BDR04DRAFT_85186 [Suillus decipiens]|nr:hypothetical protein BDR04DRAFT_85186 [Suillus decipiens]
MSQEIQTSALVRNSVTLLQEVTTCHGMSHNTTCWRPTLWRPMLHTQSVVKVILVQPSLLCNKYNIALAVQLIVLCFILFSILYLSFRHMHYRYQGTRKTGERKERFPAVRKRPSSWTMKGNNWCIPQGYYDSRSSCATLHNNLSSFKFQPLGTRTSIAQVMACI